ncbi:MAG TPA: hypothetical protein VEJ88_04850 [Dissulfurispiraceae bacterium]|nr:hypothetical protein [Dissulfurispiraceae bacterium]
MKRPALNGTCSICGGVFSKMVMTRHLASCMREPGDTPVCGGNKSGTEKTFHMVIEGNGLPEYWLHVEASASSSLATLDRFLRDLWLECCGHMSAFRIGAEEYMSSPEPGTGEHGMNVALNKVLCKGIKFRHEYDFGTTTEINLKVVAEQGAEKSKKPIRLLARNDPPIMNCVSCGKPAIRVCTECIYESSGLFCKECAKQHECGEEMLLPVVNSPRVGMCAYSG